MLVWARMYLFSSVFIQSHFVASRPADPLLFDNALEGEQQKLASKNIRENIHLKFPIIQGAEIADLLNVRSSERDAFLNFRAKMVGLEGELRSKGDEITAEVARSIYEDLVFPELDKLEAKVNSIKRDLRSSAARRLAIVSTFAVIGFASGLLPGQVGALLEVVGACEVAETAVDLWKSVGVPEAVRQDPFYILWNIRRYREHAESHGN